MLCSRLETESVYNSHKATHPLFSVTIKSWVGQFEALAAEHKRVVDELTDILARTEANAASLKKEHEGFLNSTALTEANKRASEIAELKSMLDERETDIDHLRKRMGHAMHIAGEKNKELTEKNKTIDELKEKLQKAQADISRLEVMFCEQLTKQVDAALHQVEGSPRGKGGLTDTKGLNDAEMEIEDMLVSLRQKLSETRAYAPLEILQDANET